MAMSVVVLIVSAALCFFYIELLCGKILRQEFSRPYFQEVIQAIHLEFPRLGDSIATNGHGACRNARLALELDFFTLKYLLKNGEPNRRHLLQREKILLIYFRLISFSLPIRHALNFREKEAILTLANTLQFLANSVGERWSVRLSALA